MRSAKQRIEDAAQAASETQKSWKHMCYAITDALGLDFGDPEFELPHDYERKMAALEKVVTAYDAANPMRAADLHLADCACLRCAVDEARAILKETSHCF